MFRGLEKALALLYYVSMGRMKELQPLKDSKYDTWDFVRLGVKQRLSRETCKAPVICTSGVLYQASPLLSLNDVESAHKAQIKNWPYSSSIWLITSEISPA